MLLENRPTPCRVATNICSVSGEHTSTDAASMRRCPGTRLWWRIGRVTEKKPTPGPDPGRRRTILVVDDSLTIRKQTRDLLEKSGYQVLEALNGAEGLDVAKSRTVDL